MHKYTYISSQMSGLPDDNYPAFFAKAEELRAKRHEVMNPAAEGKRPGWQWIDYILHDMEQIHLIADRLHLFGTWWKSPGAKIELQTAIREGLEIEIEQWWMRPLQWWYNKQSRKYRSTR